MLFHLPFKVSRPCGAHDLLMRPIRHHLGVLERGKQERAVRWHLVVLDLVCGAENKTGCNVHKRRSIVVFFIDMCSFRAKPGKQSVMHLALVKGIVVDLH